SFSIELPNEKSQRTLYGYVRWKLGFEDETQPGKTHFAREGCTSYVMLEFRDTENPAEVFTCGLGFEGRPPIRLSTNCTSLFPAQLPMKSNLSPATSFCPCAIFAPGSEMGRDGIGTTQARTAKNSASGSGF